MSDIESENQSLDNETIEQDQVKTYKEITNISTSYGKYFSNAKKTKPFLSKFERTKLIGIRAQMISEGSTPLVHVPKHITHSIDIAELEFKEKKIPLFIKRNINNIDYEYWRPEDMVNI